FDFAKLAPYAAVSGLIAVIPGLIAALFGPLIAASSQLTARSDSAALGRMLLNATRYATVILVVVGAPLIAYAKPLLALWVGPAYAEAGAPILQLLVLGQTLRCIWAP